MCQKNKPRNIVLAGTLNPNLLEIGKLLAAKNHNLFYFGNEQHKTNFIKENYKVVNNSYQEVIDKFFAKFKKADALIIDIGTCNLYNKSVCLKNIDQNAWEEIVEDPLFKVFCYVKYFAKNMTRLRSGKILIILSTLGQNPKKGSFVASTIDTALKSFILSASKELGRYNLTICGLCKGYFENAINEKELNTQIPLGRLGNIEEFLDAVDFFSSKKSNYINGQILTIDGGLTS